MNFSLSFWDPFKPYIIQLGEMKQDKVIETFEKISWAGYLQKMVGKKPNEIRSSPTFEIENKANNTKLTFSAVGTPTNFEYYIFYKRPKKVKQFFGLSETIKEKYLSEIKNQTYNDAISCLNAFIKNEQDFLENKMK